MTVAEMMARMTAREYDDWMAFMDLCPIGERALDYRFAMLTLPVVNALRDQRTRPLPVAFDDLYPWHTVEAETTAETPDRQFAAISAMYAMHGLIVVDDRKVDA